MSDYDLTDRLAAIDARIESIEGELRYRNPRRFHRRRSGLSYSMQLRAINAIERIEQLLYVRVFGQEDSSKPSVPIPPPISGETRSEFERDRMGEAAQYPPNVPISGDIEDRTEQYKQFEFGLRMLINLHRMESGSGTPDYLIAEYLVRCLKAYDRAMLLREQWHGRKLDGTKI